MAGDLVLPEEVVDLDLPEEVVNDELDDLFVDVTTASPQKEDRSLAKKLRRNKCYQTKCYRVFEGPTAADIQATLVQGRAPDVEAYLPRSDVGALHTAIHGGALQDDVMEVFSPPQDSRAHSDIRFARGFVS